MKIGRNIQEREKLLSDGGGGSATFKFPLRKKNKKNIGLKRLIMPKNQTYFSIFW